MKQKHFFVLLLAMAFTAFQASTSEAHPHGRFNHCNRGGYYSYRYLPPPPPPPPPVYYGYATPRHFHHHRPHHNYRGYGRRW